MNDEVKVAANLLERLAYSDEVSPEDQSRFKHLVSKVLSLDDSAFRGNVIRFCLFYDDQKENLTDERIARRLLDKLENLPVDSTKQGTAAIV